jgi:GH15 family glucan-1,4-alpha-glucosidase
MRRRLALPVVALLLSMTVISATSGPFTAPREEGLITGPGYRLPTRHPDLERVWADQLWVDSGTVPGDGTAWEPMARQALTDLRAFQSPSGAIAAGPGGPWRFFWPRDGSFAAVAFSLSDHPQEASRVMDQLARLEFDPAAGFQARYQLSGQALTDRPPQSDGCGWVLWAIAQIRRHSATGLPGSAGELRDRCVAALTGLVQGGRRLPPASPDYWEVPVERTTLGTVAPMLAGLSAASDDYRATGDWSAAADTSRTASRLARVAESAFAPQWERFGDDGGLDAAVAMLLPPFSSGDHLPTSVVGAWRGYQREALQPAGGLAPGADWVKNDGSSWTPQTALVALTAAATGHRDEAARRLTWLDAHRTAYGSLPEKVTRTGRPAGPAPLVWTSALVLLTLAELDRP